MYVVRTHGAQKEISGSVQCRACTFKCNFTVVDDIVEPGSEMYGHYCCRLCTYVRTMYCTISVEINNFMGKRAVVIARFSDWKLTRDYCCLLFTIIDVGLSGIKQLTKDGKLISFPGS